MKAAVLSTLNAPLEVWDVQPAPYRHDENLRYGQVQVRMSVSGICGSELAVIAGHKGNAGRQPHLLGHEGCGIVTATGLGVNKSILGKKVVCHWRKGEGIESPLPEYLHQDRHRVGAGAVTTLCEMPIVSENRVTVVPDDVPDELCALLGCGLSTALGTIEQEARLKMGESILIVGCGGVGLNLIQAARLAQAHPICAMDLHDEKRETALALGAHQYFNARTEKPEGPFDVIVDTSGSVEALEATVPLLSGSGRYIMVGHPRPGESFRVLSAANMFFGEGKMIKATQGGGFRPSVDIKRYVNLWRSGALDIESIISHRIGLDEINHGIDLVRVGQAGRIMVALK